MNIYGISAQRVEIKVLWQIRVGLRNYVTLLYMLHRLLTLHNSRTTGESASGNNVGLFIFIEFCDNFVNVLIKF